MSDATRLKASYRTCRRLARRSGGNFFVSFYGLPRDRFAAICALYSFLRISDDIADAPGYESLERRRRLDDWRGELELALGGEPPRPAPGGPPDVLPAMADAVQTHGIPPAALHEVLDGIAMDLEPTLYQTFDDLKGYCDRVAGAVGICCLHVWGFRDETAIARAVDCGTAFQLTNILRDLGQDAAMGRVYLPREDLERFGYSPQDLADGLRNDAFVALMQFEVARAWEYYERVPPLFDLIEPRGRPILRAMLRVYAGLLREIERVDYDVFEQPIRLPAWRKLLIAAGALLRLS